MSNIKLSFGYDTERPYGPVVESGENREFRKKEMRFIENLIQTLDKEQAPRTFFVLGDFLNKCKEDYSIQYLRGVFKNTPLNEIPQHSYSHQIFRQIKKREDRKAVTPEEFIADLSKANDTIKEILDIVPNGVRTPLGYYHDLTDMPDIVKGLNSLKLDFVSSDLRSEESLEGKLINERQPHTYANIGYPNIVEIPSHGWQDTLFTEEKARHYLGRGKPNSEEIINHYTNLLDDAKNLVKGGKNVYVSLCMHPHIVMEYGPRLEIHKRLIDSARKKNIDIISYGQISKEILGK